MKIPALCESVITCLSSLIALACNYTNRITLFCYYRYLLNFLLDATLGMLVIWVGVKVVSKIVEHKHLTLLMFGEYGELH